MSIAARIEAAREKLSREIVLAIASDAISLFLSRNHHLIDEDEVVDEADAIRDVVECLTGDETGCIDPEDLDSTNCRRLWLIEKLAPSTLETINEEELAKELHRQYRAAEKALNRTRTVWRKGKQIPNPNLLLHDHGFDACGKKTYFRKRAALVIARAKCLDPQTLGETEQALASEVLRRRLAMGVTR